MVEIKIGAFYSVYNQPRATYECLKAFRAHYPEAPVWMISDNGLDFSRIAQHFHCTYIHSNDQTGDGTATYFNRLYQAYLWLSRVRNACERFVNVDWIVILEDDVLTRSTILHIPTAPMAGPCTVPFSDQLVEFVKSKYPWLEINGYSGCGGTIFHRETFLRCMLSVFDISQAATLDSRVARASDALLTYLFLFNGFENKPWLDQSETSHGRGSSTAAFDHQYKKYYGAPWDESMLNT